MDTSNNQNDFRVIDLLQSEFDEDHELAEKAIHTLQALVQELKPVLRYLTEPILVYYPGDGEKYGEELGGEEFRDPKLRNAPLRRFRGVELLTIKVDGGWTGTHVLFINEKMFFVSSRNEGKLFYFHGDGGQIHNPPQSFLAFRPTSTWEKFLFSELLQALKNIFNKAIEKREKHLESIKQRSKILDKILDVVNNS